MDMVAMAKRGSALASTAAATATAVGTAAIKAAVGGEAQDPLDTFVETEKLFVKQKIETMEAVANAVAGAVGLSEFASLGETANKYDAYTNSGGKQFKIVETSDACSWDGWIPTGRYEDRRPARLLLGRDRRLLPVCLVLVLVRLATDHRLDVGCPKGRHHRLAESPEGEKVDNKRARGLGLSSWLH